MHLAIDQKVFVGEELSKMVLLGQKKFVNVTS
jgi:hypothetical protein